MDEEVHYSEVTFKTNGQHPIAKKEEQVIYSDVNIKACASPESTPAQDVKGATNVPHFRLLAASVVTLFILLLLTTTLLIYLGVMMHQQRANLSDVSAKNQQLITERSILQNTTQELSSQKSILEKKTGELSRQVDSLEWTMGQIMKFNNFPVNKFCPERECQPCQTGWIQFDQKCYFFYNEKPRWKTWAQSQTLCKNNGSDLVVIETLREQEFISNNIEYYYSNNHGFWIGLKENDDNSWSWVDGRKDTLGFWINGLLGPAGSRALMIPGQHPNASWDSAWKKMENKFICETELLTKSF